MGMSPRSSFSKTMADPFPLKHELREELLQITNGYMVSQCLYVAAKLAIADLLKDGPRDSADLARACSVQASPLYRVLRALSRIGIFHELEAGSFELTPKAQLLRSDVEGSVRGWTIMRGENYCWQPWGAILESVRTGVPAFDHVFGMGVFEHLSKHPEASASFDSAMRSISAEKYPAVADSYDFSEVHTLIDIGGGNGGLLTAVLNQHPHLNSILCDLPQVIESGEEKLAEAGLSDRCRCLAIDMFEGVPEGGDAYILANVIHDWSDELALTILKNCRRAMSKGSRLLLVEMIIPEGDEFGLPILVDIEMLVMTDGGKERTEDEFRALYAAGGFRLTRAVPTPTPWSVIEGFAV